MITENIELNPEILAVADGKGSLPLHRLLEKISSSIEDALQMIEAYPEALKHQNTNGCLPLHIECKNQCRLPIIAACIDLYPESLAVTDEFKNYPLQISFLNAFCTVNILLMMIEKRFLLISDEGTPRIHPIHLLCRTGSRNPTCSITQCIEAYLQQLGVPDENNNLPLHLLLLNTHSSEVDALTMIDLYPAALEHQNSMKYLPLHIECGKQCRTSIILRCIVAHPESLTVSDVYGDLPLHSLLKNQASMENAFVMIDSYPDALEHQNTQGYLPLHIECKVLRRSSVLARCLEFLPLSLAVPDVKGDLPLHLLLHNAASSMEDALIMIDSYPEALEHQDAHGYLPLHIECKIQCRSTIISKCLEFLPTCLAVIDTEGNLPLHRLLENESSYSNDALMMIEAYPAALKHQNKSGKLPIHMECRNRCRPSVIAKCIERYPEGLAVVDEKDYLPLHRLYRASKKLCTESLLVMIIDAYPAALKHQPRSRYLPIHTECRNQCRSSIIAKFTALYPEGLAIPDAHGYLPLHRLLQNKYSTEDDVLMMIEAYPAALEHRNDEGHLPLHMEINYQRRTSVIEKCIVLHPEGLIVPDICGNLPLHSLLTSILSSMKIALMMIEACPAALAHRNNDGQLPLHLECKGQRRSSVLEKIMALNPESLVVPDAKDCLPLHIFLDSYPSLEEGALMMIDACPAALAHRNSEGYLPLHIECNSQHRSSIIAKCMALYPEGLAVPDLRGYLPLHLLLERKLSTVEDALMMIEAYPAALEHRNNDGYLPLHMECRVQRRSSVLARLMALNPEGLSVADEKGCLPLHILFKCPRPSGEDATMVIEKYPSALKHRNFSDQLPIHIECKNQFRSSVLLKCIKLYPESLNNQVISSIVEKVGISGDIRLHASVLTLVFTLMPMSLYDFNLENDIRKNPYYRRKILKLLPDNVFSHRHEADYADLNWKPRSAIMLLSSQILRSAERMNLELKTDMRAATPPSIEV